MSVSRGTRMKRLSTAWQISSGFSGRVEAPGPSSLTDVFYYLFEAEFLHWQDRLLILNWLVWVFFWCNAIVFFHLSNSRHTPEMICWSQGSFVWPALKTWSSLLNKVTTRPITSFIRHELVKLLTFKKPKKGEGWVGVCWLLGRVTQLWGE